MDFRIALAWTQVNWVQIDAEKEDEDHMISAAERFKVAMARQ